MSTTDRIEARLVIKGDCAEAIKAVESRRLPFVMERETDRETVGVTFATVEQLNRWFCESTDTPYPTGSLLLWTELKEGQDRRAVALVQHLGCDVGDVEADGPANYGHGTRFTASATEWDVYTEEEADEAAADYIRESLWAFNADFLAAYMPEGIDAREIEAIRGDRCEDANPAFLALVADRQADLIRDAIAADGRGHFLSGYDGEEIELGGDLFAYRVN